MFNWIELPNWTSKHWCTEKLRLANGPSVFKEGQKKFWKNSQIKIWDAEKPQHKEDYHHEKKILVSTEYKMVRWIITVIWWKRSIWLRSCFDFRKQMGRKTEQERGMNNRSKQLCALISTFFSQKGTYVSTKKTLGFEFEKMVTNFVFISDNQYQFSSARSREYILKTRNTTAAWR